MSADGSRTCPECKARIAERISDRKTFIKSQYGKIPEEDYEKLKTELPALEGVEAGETVREEWEIHFRDADYRPAHLFPSKEAEAYIPLEGESLTMDITYLGYCEEETCSHEVSFKLSLPVFGKEGDIVLKNNLPEISKVLNSFGINFVLEITK